MEVNEKTLLISPVNLTARWNVGISSLLQICRTCAVCSWIRSCGVCRCRTKVRRDLLWFFFLRNGIFSRLEWCEWYLNVMYALLDMFLRFCVFKGDKSTTNFVVF